MYRACDKPLNHYAFDATTTPRPSATLYEVLFRGLFGKGTDWVDMLCLLRNVICTYRCPGFPHSGYFFAPTLDPQPSSGTSSQ